MFMSTVTNSLDAKGRVSVPADFRATISATPSKLPFDGIVVYDAERSALQYMIFSSARQLAFDGGGRVSLPKDLHEYAGLNGKVTFVGLGRRFEIWSPKALEERKEGLLALARESRHLLKTVIPGGGS